MAIITSLYTFNFALMAENDLLAFVEFERLFQIHAVVSFENSETVHGVRI